MVNAGFTWHIKQAHVFFWAFYINQRYRYPKHSSTGEMHHVVVYIPYYTLNDKLAQVEVIRKQSPTIHDSHFRP